jgi:regulator-associated protein of mTOR
MTAVAVQQRNPRQQYNPRQSPHISSRSSAQATESYPNIPTTQSHTPQTPQTPQHPAPTATNGAANSTTSRPTSIKDPRVIIADGAPVLAQQSQNGASSTNGQPAAAMDQTKERRQSDSLWAAQLRRNGNDASSTTALQQYTPAPEDSEREENARAPKPVLQRSKSDFGPRGETPEEEHDNDNQDWGARHGFEDHYASEEYVSQLANVSNFPLSPTCAIVYKRKANVLCRTGTCTSPTSAMSRPETLAL